MNSSITPQRSSLFHAGAMILLFAFCLYGFYDVAHLHGKYKLLYGKGVMNIHPNELMLYIWYLVFGIPAIYFLSSLLQSTSFPQQAEIVVRSFIQHRFFLIGSVVLLLSSIALFHFFVLNNASIADDENTYLFIAQTLLEGRVLNPHPGDEAYFSNQFINFNNKGWYGKYPIGFPALLALGEIINLPRIINPILTGLSLLLTYYIGIRIFDKVTAGLAVCFLLISPHFVFTGATYLSQPASTLFMLIGFYAMLRLYEIPSWQWALLAGAAWGYGILIRPLPGVLFLFVACLHFLLTHNKTNNTRPWWQSLQWLSIAALPVLVCGIVFLWINKAQTGASTQTGYHIAHSSLYLFDSRPGILSSSMGGAWLRENFWLFGWPISLLFIFLAKGRYLGLFWGLVAADYAYRIISPKTVVATTGPIYVTEAVPLLCLATASGMTRLKQQLETWGIPRIKQWLLALVISATLVGCAMFLVIQIQQIQRSSKIWTTPYRMLKQAKAKKKLLVFANFMIPLSFQDSWAYLPPNPSPSWKGDIIFVRHPTDKDSSQKMLDFWKRRFPQREAWLFYYHQGNQPTLVKLGG